MEGPEIIILTEVSQRKASIILYHLNVGCKKINTNGLTDSQTQKKITVTKGGGGEGQIRSVGLTDNTLLYIK